MKTNNSTSELTFTGRRGEYDAAIRAEVVAGYDRLMFCLGRIHNVRASGRTTTDSSVLLAWVVPTEEEWLIVPRTPSFPAAA
jgi:acetate kinase